MGWEPDDATPEHYKAVSEPDDVERLVAEIEHGQCAHEAGICYPGSELGARLGRIVRELLAEHVAGPCINENIPAELSCSSVWPRTQQLWCDPCRARALRARLNAIARGEEA